MVYSYSKNVLSPNEENNIKQQIQKSICTLKINNDLKDYAFLCKLPKINTKIVLASTQNIQKEELNNLQSFELIFNNNTSITLDNSTKYFTNDIINIMFIEISNNIYLNNYNIDFLEIENQYNNANKHIYLLNNYCFNNNNSVTTGMINSFDYDNNIIEYDLLGINIYFSLIIYRNNRKVIGINNINNKIKGYYLKPFVDEFLEDYQKDCNSLDIKKNNSENYLEKKNIDYNSDKNAKKRLSKSWKAYIIKLDSLKNNTLDSINDINFSNNTMDMINENGIINNNNYINSNNNDLNDANNQDTKVMLNDNFFNKKNEKFAINIKFFNIKNNNNNYSNYEKKELSGILNLCLIKIISNLFDANNIYKVGDQDLKNIINQLRDSLNFTNDTKHDIELILKEKTGNNILAYSEYINSIIDTQKINYMKNLLDNNKQNEIDIYWRCLSNYEEYGSFFEKEFINDLRQTYFDYSLIALNILEKDNENIYKQKRNSCPNVVKRIMYHGTQIDVIGKILTSEFKYSRKPFYGMGIYFSDMIDYIPFYCGGDNYDNRRINFEKIASVGGTFSLIASEMFYDSTKKLHIKDKSLIIDAELKTFPTYEDLKRYYPDKMVQPNGVHFIQVKSDGEPIADKTIINKESKMGFIANEYVITELYQILPIYGLTLKRNEFFVLWYDPEFSGKNAYSEKLRKIKILCESKANMNIYCESSFMTAIKFLWKRRYNKVILISSINKNSNWIKFIEIAREILGSKTLVLLCDNKEQSKEDTFQKIEEFEYCLYADIEDKRVFEYYISNFTKYYDLLNLKAIVERNYNINLKDFGEDYLLYQNFVDNKEYKEVDFTQKNPYIKQVFIFCEKKKRYLVMTNDGNLINSDEPELWDVFFDKKDIYFYSNGFHLGVKNNQENAIGVKYMKKWYFKNPAENLYVFALKEKKENNILSMEGTWIKVNKNKNKVGSYELFKLIEI